MRLAEIQKIAVDGYCGGEDYPDGIWDEDGRPTDALTLEHVGDTLLIFVVRELADTYDPSADDLTQLAEAAQYIERAATELTGCSTALESEYVRRAHQDVPEVHEDPDMESPEFPTYTGSDGREHGEY